MSEQHMDERYPDLALQRRLLHAESALLRHALTDQVSRITAPVWTAADRAQAGVRWVQAHPVVATGAAGVALALVLRRPAVALSWLGRGLALWRLWR